MSFISIHKVFIAVLLSLIVFPIVGYSKSAPKVYIVHSYHDTFEWTEKTHRGILQAFKDANMNPTYIIKYMDSKRKDGQDRLISLAKEIIQDIHKQKPDIIMLSDDNALKYVGNPLKNSPYPIVFSGINADPRKSGIIQSYESSGNSITGILERYPLLSMIRLGKKLVPKADNIYFFFDASLTGHSIRSDYERQIKTSKIQNELTKMGLQIQPFTFSNSWELWKKNLKNIDPKTSIVFLQAFFTTRDQNGQNVPYQKISKWIADNTKLANFSVTNLHYLEGFLASFSFSGFDQGFFAGELGIQVLKGTKPKDIPIVNPDNYRLYINSVRSKDIGIKIPYNLLSYSKKNWDDYHMKKDKERNKL